MSVTPEWIRSTGSAARRALLVAMLASAAAMTAAPNALAQGAGKSDRVMTREELRACMKRNDTLKNDKGELERSRGALDTEKAEIAKDRDALDQQLKAVAAERDTVDKADEAAVKAYNDKANAFIATYNTRKAEQDAKVDAWNAKNRAHTDRAAGYEQELKGYNDTCASRRFREDDEKAIRAGK